MAITLKKKVKLLTKVRTKRQMCITIQGTNLQGVKVSCQFETDGRKTTTNRLARTFKDMYHLFDVTIL